jgi:hypothetical protein
VEGCFDAQDFALAVFLFWLGILTASLAFRTTRVLILAKIASKSTMISYTTLLTSPAISEFAQSLSSPCRMEGYDLHTASAVSQTSGAFNDA